MSDQHRHPFAWLAAVAALITVIVGVLTLWDRCQPPRPTPTPTPTLTPTPTPTPTLTPTPTPTLTPTPTPTPTPNPGSISLSTSVYQALPTPTPPKLLGTWICVDPKSGNTLKTVTFNSDGTYEEGNQRISGNHYSYDDQTHELTFLYREQVMERGRVMPIDENAFQFKVLGGYTPTMKLESIYEFRR